MVNILRTDSNNEDFINLVKDLDAYLKTTDGEEHEFYNQFNHIDVLPYVVVAYVDNKPVACGAFKEFNTSSIEIKRMYTSPPSRGQGLATLVLNALEIWAKELNYGSCVLETGIRQKEAVQFYKRNNYLTIPNYGQYVKMANSLCFKKTLYK